MRHEILKDTAQGAGRMVPLGKRLLYSHEEQSSDPQRAHERLGVVVHTPGTPVLGRSSKEDPQSSLASQPGLIGELQVQ